MIQLFHNSRCGKSRECLTFLENSGQKYEIINYLKQSPTFDELKSILQKLNLKPIELVRKKEKIWIENFKNNSLSDDDILTAMVSNPILIERPIVINGEKAVIARPCEKAASVF